VLPLRDDNPTRRFAWVTFAIIALNVVAFLLWEPTFATGPEAAARQNVFFFCHAEIPWEITHQTSLGQGGPAAVDAIAKGLDESADEARSDQRELARDCGHKNWLASVFTAMFLHAGWLHIGGNMLFLWIFGNNVEDRLGRVRYLLFYLAAGIAATVAQLIPDAAGVIPNLGASGAIAGVLGAYLVMFPRRRVLTVVFFFIITFVYLPAILVLGAWFVLQVFSGIGSLSQNVNTGGVAFWAHVGGFAFGALVALAFFPKEGFGRPAPRRPDRPLGSGYGWGRRRRAPPPPWG
jgi:membrane associated rhomboid family serine protease